MHIFLSAICNRNHLCNAELRTISMGQGQEVHARRHMQQAMQSGDWVLLQNCHLSLDYVAELIDTMTDTPVAQMHDNFRLWVTSEVHPKFPITFLQVNLHSFGNCYLRAFTV